MAGERDYVVLALLSEPEPPDCLSFMLFLPDGVVTDWAWYDSERFEIADRSLPPNWVFWDHGGGSFSLMPDAWTRAFFWDDILGDDSAKRERAWSDYKTERRDLILSQAGRRRGRAAGVSTMPAPSSRRDH